MLKTVSADVSDCEGREKTLWESWAKATAGTRHGTESANAKDRLEKDIREALNWNKQRSALAARDVYWFLIISLVNVLFHLTFYSDILY
ncbi:hypothetical protein AA3266_1853 [Gluconobacter kondonii NBRC 3266]|nr:hypothetical protein AA3266_1853 [Gluconobacter kondonii NBRC 3266]